jgi:heavy metal sensor kinase
MSLPIRTRLTLWYSGVLLLVFLAFWAAMYLSYRASLVESIDVELRDRLAGVEHYMRSEFGRFPRSRLAHELEENIQLRPDEMLQISDRSGWVFQSRSIGRLQLESDRPQESASLRTAVVQGSPFRIETADLSVNAEHYQVQLAAALGPPYRALTRFLRALLGFIPLLVLAASGGGYWLSRRALTPIDRIIEDARSIGHYNLSRRLMAPRTGDELERLSETLNEMIARLEAAFQRITRFTADASHELRTPVAFIRTTAEVALLQPRTAAAYRTAIGDIYDETLRMTELIENLLALARADSGSSQLNLAPLDVREPVNRACSRAVSRARDKKICFSAGLPERAVCVMGDSVALQRLCWILIDNAIKYTPTGGRVDVQVARSGSSAVVTVRDTGIGIAESEQGRIFERFYRSGNAHDRDSGGAGLGLSIARWIADVHHAQIEVESKPDAGSAFSVRFERAG